MSGRSHHSPTPLGHYVSQCPQTDQDLNVAWIQVYEVLIQDNLCLLLIISYVDEKLKWFKTQVHLVNYDKSCECESYKSTGASRCIQVQVVKQKSLRVEQFQQLNSDSHSLSPALSDSYSINFRKYGHGFTLFSLRLI